MPWFRIADVADCPAGASEHVAGGRVVALFAVDGRYFALDGICPHQGGPLGQGQLDEGQPDEGSGVGAAAEAACYVTCPWHGWQFNIRNGRHRTSPLQHASLPLKIEGGAIYVDVES